MVDSISKIKNKCPQCGGDRWTVAYSSDNLKAFSAECEKCGFKFETDPPPEDAD